MTAPERAGYLEQRYHYLNAVLQGSSNDDMARMLSMVAVTKGVDGPTDEAITVYYRLLSSYPADILWEAVKSLLSTHVYKTFPQPAEFINAIDKDELRTRREDLRSVEKWLGIGHNPKKSSGFKQIGQIKS